MQLSNSAILARMLSCNTRSWVHHAGLVWSHYPPAIKHGNGKSPRNGGLDGKIVLLLLTPCMDGQERLHTPGIPKFCPWLQRVTPVVHSKPAAGFKEPHGPGPRDHLDHSQVVGRKLSWFITGWSGRGWITTSRRKRSSLARFQCWGYSLVSWLPI